MPKKAKAEAAEKKRREPEALGEQEVREGTRRGLKRHADAPQQGDEGAPTTRLISHTKGQRASCIVYFDRKTHKRVVLEITRVAITQASISGSGVLAGPDAVLSILRARERERRRCARISAIVEHDEGNTLFIPIVLTSCGGFGPSAQKYLKHIYGRARENSCSDMGVGQPTFQTTWITPHVSTY